MSNNRRVVLSSKNLPFRPPWYQTLILWMALDYWHAPGWVWGAVGLFMVTAWVIAIVDIFTRVDVPLEDFQKRPKP